MGQIQAFKRCLAKIIYKKGEPMEGKNVIFVCTKKDCFAYSSMHDKCRVLTETVCKKGTCKFYKTKKEFEKGLEKYEQGNFNR